MKFRIYEKKSHCIQKKREKGKKKKKKAWKKGLSVKKKKKKITSRLKKKESLEQENLEKIDKYPKESVDWSSSDESWVFATLSVTIYPLSYLNPKPNTTTLKPYWRLKTLVVETRFSYKPTLAILTGYYEWPLYEPTYYLSDWVNPLVRMRRYAWWRDYEL